MQLGFELDVELMVGAQRKCNAHGRALCTHGGRGRGRGRDRGSHDESRTLHLVCRFIILPERALEHSGFMIIADLSFSLQI